MEIALVGDVMLGRLVNDRLRHVPPRYVWGDTLPVLARADLRFANLECVLADSGVPWPGKVFHFRSDADNVACLEAARIDVVSLANNHTLDFGAGALLQTLALLDGAGIAHAGAGRNAEEAGAPAACRMGTMRVGLVAFTDNEPDWAAGPHSAGTAYVPADPSDTRARALLQLLRSVRDDADLLIASAHWGGNWGREVPGGHRAMAHALIAAGADLVFGHSAHVFRGIEVFAGRPIVYSAGDFIDDYAVDPDERNDESFVFVLDVQDAAPRRLRLYPTVIEECQARMAGPRSRAIAAEMGRLCAALGTPTRWIEDEACLAIPCAPELPTGV
ncbi:CapA family protein [Sinomonas flava]|uniref:CapA family protein n=1 Tax=Sinomonas flava TaxID=496857 RepID=UPI0039A5A972